MRPEDYPWEQAAHPGLLVGHRLVPMDCRRGAGQAPVIRRRTGVRSLQGEVRRRGGAPMSVRTAVLAVGSNGSPAALGRKLVRAGASTVVPMVPVHVEGMGVGHSSHRAAAGYVPAAPFHDPESTSRVVLLLLDPQQLRAVDRTEPNYRRIWLARADYPVSSPCGALLAGGSRKRTSSEGYWVYESRWGVLVAARKPLRLQPQPLASEAFDEAGGRPGAGVVEGSRLVSAGRPSSPSRRWTW